MSIQVLVRFRCDTRRLMDDSERCQSTTEEWWFDAEVVEVRGEPEPYDSYEPTRRVLEVSHYPRLIPRGWGEYPKDEQCPMTPGTYCPRCCRHDSVVRSSRDD